MPTIDISEGTYSLLTAIALELVPYHGKLSLDTVLDIVLTYYSGGAEAISIRLELLANTRPMPSDYTTGIVGPD